MLLYIIQANIAFAVLALIYRYLLSHDTLFNVRRAFLLTIVVVAFTFQFMPTIVEFDFYQSTMLTLPTTISTAHTAQTAAQSTSLNLSATNIIIAIALLGSALLLVRFIFGFIAIIRMKNSGKPSIINNHKVILIDKDSAPFSFYKWIFISPSQLNKTNLQDVITHESSHIKGMHTIDVMISEFLVIIFWFNPAAWFIRYAIRENLEFLADREVLDCGHNRKDYQYHLLKLSYQSSVNNIVNYFNVSQLKNRIIMMNREKTPRKAVIKYLLLLPALMMLSLTNNAQTQEKKTVEVRGLQFKSEEEKPLIILNGKECAPNTLEKLDPNTIESVSVLKDSSATALYMDKGKNGVIIIITKDPKQVK